MIFPYVKVTRFLKHQKIERLLPWIRFGIYNPENKFPPSMPQQTAILGTLGFFRHFNITFSYPSFIKIESKFSLKFS